MEEDYQKVVIGEEADVCFHVALSEATGNRVLLIIMSKVSELLVQTMKDSRVIMFANPENREKLLQQHREICKAVVEKQPE